MTYFIPAKSIHFLNVYLQISNQKCWNTSERIHLGKNIMELDGNYETMLSYLQSRFD